MTSSFETLRYAEVLYMQPRKLLRVSYLDLSLKHHLFPTEPPPKAANLQVRDCTNIARFRIKKIEKKKTKKNNFGRVQGLGFRARRAIAVFRFGF